jgi:hypothetical protein
VSKIVSSKPLRIVPAVEAAPLDEVTIPRASQEIRPEEPAQVIVPPAVPLISPHVEDHYKRYEQELNRGLAVKRLLGTAV